MDVVQKRKIVSLKSKNTKGRTQMKKIESIAGYISLILGIVGIVTLYWGIGVFIAMIGIVFGCIGYGYDNSKVACIGTFLCFLCVALVFISGILFG